MKLLILIVSLCASAYAQLQDRIQAGIAAFNKGDVAAAQTAFEAATKLAPDDANAWFLLAQVYVKQKNQAFALDAARKAETLGAKNADILQGLANLYAGFDPAKAASLGARYAEQKPEDKKAWQRLAEFCLATGQSERAIEAATRGLKSDKSPALHALLGRAFVDSKQWARAGAEFAEAVKLNPYDEEFHFRRAQLYLLQQDWATALAVLESARQYFDKSPQIELSMGVAYYGERDFAKAVDQFLKTIRLAPDAQQPYLFLGRILEHAGERLPEITQRFAEYHASYPKEPLGYVLHAKAIVAQLPPGSPPDLASSALKLLEQALELKEGDAEAHYLAGIVLERQGEFGKAAVHLERSIALNGSDAAAHYRLARVYARLGRKDDSERERALHEKLSNDVNAPDPRGTVSAPPRSPAADVVK